jgi:CXXX repeat radical SAM target protein
MKTDSYKKPETNSALTDDGKKDRREFLITAARVIVPTLGLLGISLSMSGARALAADSNSIGTGGCQALVQGARVPAQALATGPVPTRAKILQRHDRKTLKYRPDHH